MSANERNIKVRLVSDPQSEQRTLGALRALDRELKAVAETAKRTALTAQGVGRGSNTLGGQRGATPLSGASQAVTKQVDDMRKVGTAGKAALDALAQSTRRSTTEQGRDLDRLSKHLEGVTRNMDKMRAATMRARYSDKVMAPGVTNASSWLTGRSDFFMGSPTNATTVLPHRESQARGPASGRNGVTRWTTSLEDPQPSPHWMGAPHTEAPPPAFNWQMAPPEGVKSEKGDGLECCHQIVEELRAIRDLLAGKGDGGGGGGGDGSGGAPGPGGKQPQQQPGMSARDKALIASAVGQGLANAVGRGASMFQSYKTMEEQNVAAQNQAVQGRFLHEMLAGRPISTFIMKNRQALHGKRIQDEMRAEGKWGGTGAANAELIAQGVGGGLQTLGGLATIALPGGAAARGAAGAGSASRTVTTAGDVTGAASSLTGGPMSIYDAAKKSQTGYAETKDVLTSMQGLDALIASNPYASAAMDQLAAEAHMRASASRKLSGQHMGFRGLGAGYGYSFGESLAIGEGLQRSGGMTAMFGDRRTVKASITPNQAHRAYEMVRTGEVPMSMMAQVMPAIAGQGEGVALERVRSYLESQSKDRVVRTGRGRAESLMQMAGHGFDLGVSQNALDATWQSIGGKNAQNVERTMQAFERAVERGTQKGFTDPRTQEELVSAMGQAARGKRLEDTEGLELLAQVLSGGGSKNKPLTVAEAEGRRGAMDHVAGLFENNTFYQGVSIASAKQIMAGKGDTNLAHQMVLSSANPYELLTGSQRLSDANVSKQERWSQLNEQMGSVVRSRMAVDSDARKELDDVGGDLSKLSKKTLRSVFQLGMGVNDEQAEGFAEMFKSLGDGTLTEAKAKRLKQHGDAAAFGSIRMQELTADQLTKVFSDALEKHFKAVKPEDIERMIKDAKKDEDDGKNLDVKSGRMYIVRVLNAIDEPNAFKGKNPR